MVYQQSLDKKNRAKKSKNFHMIFVGQNPKCKYLLEKKWILKIEKCSNSFASIKSQALFTQQQKKPTKIQRFLNNFVQLLFFFNFTLLTIDIPNEMKSMIERERERKKEGEMEMEFNYKKL